MGHFRLWAKPSKPLRHTSPTCSTSRGGEAVDVGATAAAGNASSFAAAAAAAAAVAGATGAAAGKGGEGGAPADKGRVGVALLGCFLSSSSSITLWVW